MSLSVFIGSLVGHGFLSHLFQAIHSIVFTLFFSPACACNGLHSHPLSLFNLSIVRVIHGASPSTTLASLRAEILIPLLAQGAQFCSGQWLIDVSCAQNVEAALALWLVLIQSPGMALSTRRALREGDHPSGKSHPARLSNLFKKLCNPNPPCLELTFHFGRC